MISFVFDCLIWTVSTLYKTLQVVVIMFAIFFIFLVPKRWHPRWMRNGS